MWMSPWTLPRTSASPPLTLKTYPPNARAILRGCAALAWPRRAFVACHSTMLPRQRGGAELVQHAQGILMMPVFCPLATSETGEHTSRDGHDPARRGNAQQ